MWLHFNPASDALFLDVDGTLLDIAPTAQDVKVPLRLVCNLTHLQEKLGGALALISGRMIHELDQLFDPLRLRCSGAHGAEIRLTPEGEVQQSQSLSAYLRDDIAAAFNKLDGVFVEDKIYAVAVHCRQAPEQAPRIEEVLASLVDGTDKEIRIIQGRKVYEVTKETNTKGKAIDRFMAMAPFKGRRPVFLGDDTTDISAMGACLSHGGVAARVGKGLRDEKAAFASPEIVRSWINTVATEG